MTTPSKPIQRIQTNSQSTTRYWDTYFDMHRNSGAGFPQGRPWTGQREQAAKNVGRHFDGFIGSDLSPGEHIVDATGAPNREETFKTIWEAPFYPEVRYFDYDNQRKRINIRYDKYKSDLVRAEQQYYQAAAKVSMQVQGVSVVYGVTPSFQVTANVGFPPPSPRIADALIAQDSWVLGFSKYVNVELAHLMGMNEDGMTLYGGSIFLPPPEAPLPPAQVLAASDKDLAEMIAQISARAVEAALAKRDEEDRLKKKQVADRMEKARAGRGKPGPKPRVQSEPEPKYPSGMSDREPEPEEVPF